MIRFAKDIKKYWRYIVYSARATLKDEVANSFLNWLWWILDPLLFMLVYTFVFTIVFGRKQDYLCAFIFIGYTTWTFFNRSILNSVRTIKRYQSVLSKVYLPKFVLLLSNMLVNLFKMLIGYCLIFIAMFLYRVPLHFKILWMVPYLGLLFLLSFGLSCILLHCGVYIDDLGNIVNVLLRLLFYLTGVFFNPEKQLQGLVRYLMIRLNPTCYIVTSLRNAMLYNKAPVVSWLILWGIAGVILSAIGVHLIYKYERRYVKSV